jgi:DNA-binding beta-propeller fold protein YncE
MYVADSSANSIMAYTILGDHDPGPLARIEGSATRLQAAQSVALDAYGVLYTSNPNHRHGSIFEFRPGTNGDVAPNFVISGSETLLDYVRGIAIEQKTRRIFVANQTCAPGVTSTSCHASITVYEHGRSGNIAPLRSIAGSTTMLAGAGGIAVANGRIYVANGGSSGNASVVEFANQQSGNTPPMYVIAGPATQLIDPVAIAVDSYGRVAVADPGAAAVFIFSPNARGDVAPLAVIKGARTALLQPTAVAFDRRGRIWVADPTRDAIYRFPAEARGDAAWNERVAGPNTTLGDPAGIAIGP